jgi:hypothetical protein
MRRFKSSHSTPKSLSRSEALECIPYKNREVVATSQANGDILLAYPITWRPWVASLYRRLGGADQTPRMKKIQLDALGTQVWHLMNGQRSVRQIVREFSKTHRLPPQEAETAVTRFLQDLGRRGLVGLG